MILQEAISTYLAYCIEQKTLSPKTTKAYQIDLQQFAEFTGTNMTARISGNT